jgi:subtilisin family serine protease
MKVSSATLLPLALAAVFLAPRPAGAASPISPRVQDAENTIRGWVAAGRGGDVPLAAPFRELVTDLPPAGVPLAPGQEPGFRLFVVTDDPGALRAAGYAPRTVAGRVTTVTVPLSRIDALADVPGVTWVEFPRPLKPFLDVSVPEIRADVVHGTSQPPYSGSAGSGVVVGIIDTGIDFNHPDFRNQDGTSRVTRYWDQVRSGAAHPTGYTYGSEWLQTSLNGGIPALPDSNGHGTHVAGIAAGNGRSASVPADMYKYTGVAPLAEILAVRTNFYEDGLVDAVAWVESHTGGKPCVINMSLGSQFGPHDGTSTLDQAMNGLSGPGKILVAAAGNEGGQGLHAEATMAASVTTQVTFNVGPYTANGGAGNDVILIDGWSPSDASFTVKMITPNNLTVGPIGITGNVTQVTTDGTVKLQQFTSADNGDKNLLIDIWDSNGTPPAQGVWKVELTNNAAGSRQMDMWLSYVSLGTGVAISWTSNVDNTELVASPASSDSVIAVGAYVTKTVWDCIASTSPCGYTTPPAIGSAPSFSSPGPNRDGALKPDVSAPGMGIASALSAQAGEDGSTLFTNPYAILTGGDHYVSQGTSQASPHVTGTVALLLENRPTLAKKDVDSVLIQSARHDAFTGGGFSNQLGNGKIDAAAAVALVTPVRLLALTAGWESENAVVHWELAETEPGATFRVERGPARDGVFTAASPILSGGSSFSWTDPSPDPATPWYRVVAATRTGSSSVLGTVKLDARTPRVHLWQNAPNPFTASTAIAFELDRPGAVRVDVLDLSGREVAVLAARTYPAGKSEVSWDGSDARGRPAASGIYIVRLVTPDGTVLARRMALAR